MKLLPSAGSDRAWVYTVLADFTDEEPKKEQLAIRFRNAESNTMMYWGIIYNVLCYYGSCITVQRGV